MFTVHGWRVMKIESRPRWKDIEVRQLAGESNAEFIRFLRHTKSITLNFEPDKLSNVYEQSRRILQMRDCRTGSHQLLNGYEA